MKLLKKGRTILALAGLGTGPVVQIGRFAIPRAIIRINIIAMLILCVVLQYFFCVRNLTEGLHAIVGAVGIALTFISILLVYVSLMAKSREISDLFGLMENVIDSSKFFVAEFHCKSTNWKFLLLFIFRETRTFPLLK